jgi:hypothetical protein
MAVETKRSASMTTEDIIIHLFCLVDDRMPVIRKHPQAALYPSELVTIGILLALKGGFFSAFYRWLKRDYEALFAGLPHRTRLQRLLKTHRAWFDLLLAHPSFFTVLDTYPIELLLPIREGRSQRFLGGKGRDKGRWALGIKLAWLLNDHGQVVAWDWLPMNRGDNAFHPLAAQLDGQTIVCTDWGFRSAGGIPRNMMLCKKGTWNERMFAETALSLVTVVCRLKWMRHWVSGYLSAHLACAAAMFNVLLDLFHQLHPDAHPFHMSIAEFSL